MDTVQVRRWKLTFTYYEQSGGVVVERNGVPIDAGLIREPGVEMTYAELLTWADEWYLRDDMTTKRAAAIQLRNNRRNP